MPTTEKKPQAKKADAKTGKPVPKKQAARMRGRVIKSPNRKSQT